MQKVRFFLFCLLMIAFWPSYLFSQDSRFEAAYDRVYNQLQYTDIINARKVTDSLLASKNSPEQEIKALMLSAAIYRNVGNYRYAIETGKEANQKAELSGWSSWVCRSAILIAGCFRELGLMSEANMYLNLANRHTDAILDSTRLYIVKAHIFQEMAWQEIRAGKFMAGIHQVAKAKSLDDGVMENSRGSIFIHAKNNRLLGLCYLELGDYERANAYFQDALVDLADHENNIQPYLFRDQAERLLRRGDLDSCLLYLDRLKPYIQRVGQFDLKLVVHQTFAKYYKEKGDFQMAFLHFEKYQQLLSERSQESLVLADQTNQYLQEEYSSYKERNLIITWVAFITLAIVLAYIFIRKNSQSIFLMQKPVEIAVVGDEEEGFVKSESVLENELNISLDTENRLIKDLILQEKALFFLDKQISLSKLSNQLKSNPKYISYIIRKYRNQNFNDYLQRLRIQYLKESIEADPNMLGYKLSYLADFCGFSTHNKFTLAFRAVLGIPPSQYIEDLKKKDSDK